MTKKMPLKTRGSVSTSEDKTDSNSQPLLEDEKLTEDQEHSPFTSFSHDEPQPSSDYNELMLFCKKNHAGLHQHLVQLNDSAEEIYDRHMLTQIQQASIVLIKILQESNDNEEKKILEAKRAFFQACDPLTRHYSPLWKPFIFCAILTGLAVLALVFILAIMAGLVAGTIFCPWLVLSAMLDVVVGVVSFCVAVPCTIATVKLARITLYAAKKAFFDPNPYHKMRQELKQFASDEFPDENYDNLIAPSEKILTAFG